MLSAGGENSLDLVHRAVYRIVYDHVVEFVLLRELALCGFEALLHLGFVLGAASAQTGGQLLEGRRRDEYLHMIP